METLNLAQHIPTGLTQPERKKLLGLLIKTIRKQNQARMKAQVAPSGERWPERKNKSGEAMMRKMRSAKHFKVRVSSAKAAAGFTGYTAYIASVQHHGKRQQLGKRNIKYPVRELIGVTHKDTLELQQVVTEYISSIR